MAEPSDLPGEVAAAVEQAREEGHLSPVDLEGPMHRSIDDVRRKRDQARRTEALTLKLAGLTYEQIGERLEISPDGAKDLVGRTLTRAENTAVEELREVENARLDRAQAAIWTKVLEGDLKAIDVFLRLSARRSRLNGLDAPTAINLNVSVRQEMEQALNTLERVVLGEVVSRVDENDEQYERR